MEVRKITQEDIPELIRFGEKAFPDRKDKYNKLINFVFHDRISEYTGGIILLDDNNKIVGQSLYTTMNLHYNNEIRQSGWGYELIVDEKYRKETWGIEIMMACRRLFPGTCSTGSNPTALKLNQKLGYNLIGEIRKYIGISSIPFLFKTLLPSKKSYPDDINDFTLIKDKSEFRIKRFYNQYLIEPGREKDFIEWRFFSPNFKKYSVYQNKDDDYFVLRTIRYKGIEMLLVSDFRCSLNNCDSFEKMYKTIKKIAVKKRIPFVLCSSSHKITDEILEKNYAKSIGRPRPIVFSKKLKDWFHQEKIEERSLCFITFGDSDGEWNW